MNLEDYEKLTLEAKFSQEDRITSNDLAIIKIDEASIKHFKSFPWPRRLHGELLRKLNYANPKLVMFDVEFSSSSTPDNDKYFSDMINNVAYPVILPSLIKEQNIDVNGVIRYAETKPIEEFAKYSLIANANTVTDEFGSVYQYNTFSLTGVPSVAALLSNKSYLGNKRFNIDYTIDPHTIPTYSFKDIIEGNFKARDFKNKKVLVGATAIELGDIYTLPKYGRMPGVIVHALAYETLIADSSYVGFSTLKLFILAVVLITFLTFIHTDKRLLSAISINLIMVGVVYLANIILFHFLRINMPVWPLYSTIVISSVFQLLQNIKYRTNVLIDEKNNNNYNKALLNQMIKDNSNGIIITNNRGDILVSNRKANQIFCLSDKEGQRLKKIYDYLPNSKAMLEKAKAKGENKGAGQEYYKQNYMNLNDEEFHIEVIVNKTQFAQDTKNRNQKKHHEIYNFMITDITEKMQILEEKSKSELALVDLKRNDPLTKLPNRTSFNELVEDAYSVEHRDEKNIVVLVSLESLKEVNEIYGMSFGDDVLAQIAINLKQTVGRFGVVTRYSDKIYGIIYNNIEKIREDNYVSLIQKVNNLFTQTFHLHGQKINMNVAMGVAYTHQHGATAEKLMDNVNQALLYAKQSSTLNWFVYEEDLAHKLRSKRQLRDELARAIRNEELELYYQPQHNIATGELVGYEALVRWLDPEKGLRFPDEFIPIAEEYDMISDLGNTVLKLGCRDAAKWPDHITVAINVSPAQFIDSDIAKLCEKYTAMYNLPPNRLELEITESMLMDDIDSVIKALADIKKLGVKIAMDDFGTGYSSLQYLTELPFDKIKIDRSFTMNIGKSRQADALISTIVALGHSLEKTVLAEGIETEEMITLLKAAGCQLGQGYHYGKPFPKAEVAKQIASIGFKKQNRIA